MKFAFTAVLLLVGGCLVMTIGLLAVSFKKLSSDQIGLKFSVVTQSLDDKPYAEGLHHGSPGFYFIIFPSVYTTLDFDDITCLNKDGVEIKLDVSYQYKVRPKGMYEVVKQFNDHKGYRQILKYEGSAAIYETCAQYNTSQFQSERSGFQETLLTAILDRYVVLSCDINDLQVNNIDRPAKYEAAIKAKESAKESITVVRNERPKKLTKALTAKREAETQADITVEKARSEARIMMAKANSQAEAILDQYETEALTYVGLRDSLNLTTPGLLSYLAVRTISSAKKDVYIGMKSPARTSYLDLKPRLPPSA